MHVLFVHQNYPARFRFIAPRLARDFGWRCTFVTGSALPGGRRKRQQAEPRDQLLTL